MARKIDPPPWMAERRVRRLLAALQSRGQTVRFVGGCVRDAILGREVGDIDLATPDRPEAVDGLLKAAGIAAIPTGLGHGTVTAVVDGARYEITTLRRDVETDGRHARVAFTGDWSADAARRDLTINALYCDPDGTLHDPVGGLADLEAGRIRFVGDAEARIREDYLRILRYFRFLAWYGRSPPQAEALAACARLAPGMARLSGERIAAEMLRLLAAPAAASAVGLMAEHGVLAALAPELGGIERLRALCALEEAVAEADPLRRLSALIAGGGDAARAVAHRLRLSRAQRRRLETNARGSGLVSRAMAPGAVRVAHYRLGRRAATDLLLLAFAEGGDIERDGARLAGQLAMLAKSEAPALPLDGRDLQRTLGLEAGPEVGRMLAALEEWWIEGDFRPGRAELLARAGALHAAGRAAGR